MLTLIKSNLSLNRIAFNYLLKNSISCITTFRLQHQLAEYKDESCEYPRIVDMSEEGQNKHQRQVWYDSIKAMPTVEEKLYELTVQQKLKLERFIIPPVPLLYNGVFFHNYITRTHLVKGLPNKLNHMHVDKELSDIKDGLNTVLHNHYCNGWKNGSVKPLSAYLSEENAGSNLVNSLISQCYKKLAIKNDYIMNSTIQHKPRVESFWWHGGFESENNCVYEENISFLHRDIPSFVIRMKEPLSPILKMDDPLCATAEVPSYNFLPKTLFCKETPDYLSSVPGFWPGDPNEFPLLLVNTTDKLTSLIKKHKANTYDLSKIEDCCGVTSSFGYLNAVATYQGFTPFQDLTYPLVIQSILTNGQDWTFFVYQLNTIAFHADVDNFDRRNICWSSGKLRLFETIEDGQIKGIDEEVYKVLLKFLLNAPYVKSGLDLKPYLGEDVRGEEERMNMRYFLRKMMSQHPDHNAHKEEIPTWQQIYKFHKDAPPSPFVKME